MTMTNETTTAVATLEGSTGPKELIAIPPTSLLITHSELRLMYTIASTVIGSAGEAVPKGLDTPAKALAVMLAGWELGFRPMTSLRHFHCINGRTEPDAQAMQAIVLANEPSARFEWHEYTQEVCDVSLHRVGKNPVRCRYTLEDAKKSGQLGKSGPWTQYTRDMLAWSAIKRCCRLGAPDLINLGGVNVGAVEALAAGVDTLDVLEPVEYVDREAYNPGDDPEDPPMNVDPDTGEILDGQPSLLP